MEIIKGQNFMLTCNYQFKLKPNRRQVIEIENYLIACRKVWNYALTERKDWSKSRKNNIDRCSLEKEYIISADAPYPIYKLQAAALTEARKICPDLKDINAQVLQQVLRQLDRAFVEMKSLNKGFPRFKNRLCDGNGMIFVEDIDFKSWSSNMLCKHNLDASFGEAPHSTSNAFEVGRGQFFQILSHVCWKRDVYFAKVDKNYTSQICPSCGVHTGKKKLSDRIHNCPECGFSCNRDFAASLVIRNRGINAVGQPVLENASGEVLTGLG